MGKSSDFPQSHSPGPKCENPPPRSCTHPCPRLRCPPASVSLYPHSMSSGHVPPDTTESVAVAGGACCVAPANLGGHQEKQTKWVRASRWIPRDQDEGVAGHHQEAPLRGSSVLGVWRPLPCHEAQTGSPPLSQPQFPQLQGEIITESAPERQQDR